MLTVMWSIVENTSCHMDILSYILYSQYNYTLNLDVTTPPFAPFYCASCIFSFPLISLCVGCVFLSMTHPFIVPKEESLVAKCKISSVQYSSVTSRFVMLCV